MADEISEGRKVAYYLGAALQVVGLLMFLSVFFTFATGIGNHRFDPNPSSLFIRAFGGVLIAGVGGAIRSLGAKGLAGSGVILDPKQAREDLEPYSRMAGGMVKDALEESNLGSAREPGQVVMVRCPSCRHLNQETAKFCQECGAKL